MGAGKFHIARYVMDEATGAYVSDGGVRSLEDDFGFCRYKSITGINAIGKQKRVYTESYPESDSLRVYADPSARQEAISSTLSVCVFGADPSLPSTLGTEELVKSAEDSWHELVGFLRGGLILWADDYRQRKALFVLQDAIEPTTDSIKGLPYLDCQVKLQNIFGETFESADVTIENWLKSGGKEAQS